MHGGSRLPRRADPMSTAEHEQHWRSSRLADSGTVSLVKQPGGSGGVLGASPAFLPIPLPNPWRCDLAQQIDGDQEIRQVVRAFRLGRGPLDPRDCVLGLHERRQSLADHTVGLRLRH
jgi:hypothetical protein